MLAEGKEWFRTGGKPFQSRKVAVVMKGSCCICESKPTHKGRLLSKTYEVGGGSLIRGRSGEAMAVESESIACGGLAPGAGGGGRGGVVEVQGV